MMLHAMLNLSVDSTNQPIICRVALPTLIEIIAMDSKGPQDVYGVRH